MIKTDISVWIKGLKMQFDVFIYVEISMYLFYPFAPLTFFDVRLNFILLFFLKYRNIHLFSR